LGPQFVVVSVLEVNRRITVTDLDVVVLGEEREVGQRVEFRVIPRQFFLSQLRGKM
jgi:hypothetical protein